MIRKECLEEVCNGLTELVSKYKRNSTSGDNKRLQASKEALKALRSVILYMEINDNIIDIQPYVNAKKGKAGWRTTNTDQTIKTY